MRVALRTWLSAVFVGVTATVVTPTLAQPTVWQRARNPRSGEAYRSLVFGERLLASSAQSANSALMRGRFREAARDIVSLAENEPDARIRYLLGHLLIDRDDKATLKRARRLLKRALKEAPNSPLAGDAYFDLGIIAAKLGERRGEEAAYTKALARHWDPDARANTYLNRAESRMARQALDRAIADYRKSARIATRPEIQALALWGLAVALERNGDLPSALGTARTAQSVAPLALSGSGVFFVPAYEKHYYWAITWMGLADIARDDDVRLTIYRDCAKAWKRYIQGARPDRAPWVMHAEAHRTTCQRRAKEVAKRLPADQPMELPTGPLFKP